MSEKLLSYEKDFNPNDIFGTLNGNITAMENILNVRVELAKDGVSITGSDDDVQKADVVLKRLIDLSDGGENISIQLVNYLSEMARDGNLQLVAGYSPDSICVTAKGRPIRSKTIGQKQYVKAIEENELVFSIGPAGTGKTFLAVAMAVNAFRNKKISRIILTRPAVEAGENLGFLPGDLQMKVDPYMRPLYDSLIELMGADGYMRNLERGTIEVSPLAYMRGRTLDDAFIILDEAQNTTPEQMKMFLTRIGFNSKAVVTGDITQIDLPVHKKCGLIEAQKILQNVSGVNFVTLNQKDVVRSGLVQRIVRAYEDDKMKKGEQQL